MPITIHYAELPVENISFAYSPGQEALHSLHVLADSRNHPLHVPWVLRARRALSPSLKAEFAQFEFLVRQQRLPVLWDLRTPGALRTFDEDVAELRRGSPDEFAHMLAAVALGHTGPLRDCETAPTIRDAALRHPEQAPFFKALAERPDAVLDRFCQFLQGYWDACLAPQWDEIEELFAADIERRGRGLLRIGPAGALAALSPDMRLDRAASTVSVARQINLDVTLTRSDTLTLTPSYFAWPHLFANPYPPNLLIAYPVLQQQREARAPVPPEQLLKLLRAAGDTSRLQILQLVGSRPRSTGELAGMIGISEAAVSKHLKQLQEAGLVTAERQSYYVFYRAVREPISELARGLEELMTPDGATAE